MKDDATITARCHCGAVLLTAQLRRGMRAGRCDCSFCARRQAANVAADWDSVEILQGAEALTLYQFGTKTAEHWFCARCGIYTHHRRRSDPTEAGINAGCIDGADFRALEAAGIPVFDGRNHPADR